MYTPTSGRHPLSLLRTGWFTLVAGMLLLAVLVLPASGSSASLIPEADENLLTSDIQAQPAAVAPGEEITFTVNLRNTGTASAVVSVTVALPAELAPVPDSILGGGVQEANNVVWNSIPVPIDGVVPLSFRATPIVAVSNVKAVTAVAAIMSEHIHFTRFVQVQLVPPPEPVPDSNLAGSTKTASRHVLGPNEVLTYTINLHNSGTLSAAVDVTDVVPGPLNYVLDSVTGDGVYDPDTKTLTWTRIVVEAGADVPLTFAVTSASNVPTAVMNVATFSVQGGSTFQRGAAIWLVPDDLNGDMIPPVVHNLTIGDQDILTDRQVTLHIDATDNVAVTQMKLREWQLATAPLPHWEVVTSTAWLPYQADVDWTLGPASGTHFIGVWVADAAGNTSHLDRHALDFASLIQPATEVVADGSVPYLVHYAAGVHVRAILTPTTGTADLYLWYPGHLTTPDHGNNSIEFTTPVAGDYLFLAFAQTDAIYDLSIVPNGGQPITAASSAASTSTANNPLVATGLDPLGDISAPSDVPLADENLLTSDITVIPGAVTEGDEANVTVNLRNTGTAGAVVSVTVAVPPELVPVAGSITGGGTQDANNVVWNGVPVAAGATVPLSFHLTPTGTITHEHNVMVVAAIMTQYLHLTRFTPVMLVPPPPPTPAPNLVGSTKTASQLVLTPAGMLTYTINLHNSGTLSATVNVTDVVPAELTYVPDSVTGGGVYVSGTLTWNAIEVAPGSDVPLTFAVTTASTLPAIVTNHAQIGVVDGPIYQRNATILVMPRPITGDIVRPVVHDLKIGDQDVLTDPQVTLHISATDNVEVTQMKLREWQLATTPHPHWEVVTSTEWLPYQPTVDWTLGSSSGTHFIGVWVGDAAGNTSLLTRHALDFASLIQPAATLGAGGVTPYLVHYDSGVTVQAILTPTTGTADLLVWYPGNLLVADHASNSIGFTTPRAGDYLFLVVAQTDVVYDLSIAPAGGQLPLNGVSRVTAPTAANNPLIISGLDPLGDPSAPADPPQGGENLLTSDIVVAPNVIAPTSEATFTVTLRNTGTAGAMVSVTVALPTELVPVTGTISGGGSVDGNNVVWGNVSVPMGASVPLTFRATPAISVSQDTNVTVVAAIMSDQLHLIRFVQLLLVPPQPPTPGANLITSNKNASQQTLTADEVLTYTINLINTGTATGVVTVTDPIPLKLNYVIGSATGGGVYDPIAKTVTWTAINVPTSTTVSRSFAVTTTGVSVPTVVTNTATIVVGDQSIERSAHVVLMPKGVTPSDLHLSYKVASKWAVAPGETLTYTIKVVNSDAVTATATVVDAVPSVMTYVSGSATNGGAYAAGVVTWSNLEVPPHGSISVSFAVTVKADATTPSLVMNTATIASGNTSIERQAWVVVTAHPVPMPKPNLLGSYKIGSKFVLAANETLTYTIRLINSGAVSGTVDVVDPIPAPLTYVAGSASNGGVFSATTNALTWTNIEVPAGGYVSLSFAVTAPVTVTSPTHVINVANINVANGPSFQRSTHTLLIPAPSNADVIAPVVRAVTIDEGDVLTSPTVTLHISATDNVGVQWMYIREWQLITTPTPHWAVAHTGGWVPYQADYPWTLINASGTHYVGVWVADAARNVSRLNHNALDFASLLLPGTSIPKGGLVPYLVHYAAGVNVTATLTTLSGDADLYVWYPGNHFLADQKSTQAGTATDIVTVTTPTAGTYLFLVHGSAASTYDLSITPVGGPASMLFSATALVGTPTSLLGPNDELTTEPVLSQSGLDPLADVTAPTEPYVVYLPIVRR
ncbi:MAG: hypothetical protein U0559_09625 [Anaerolineae bacterium]